MTTYVKIRIIREAFPKVNMYRFPEPVNDNLDYLFPGTYDLPFLLAGVPPIIGALTMFLIRCVKENNEGSLNDSENIPSKTDCQNGR